MSIAGKRSGLDGSRSGLFHEAIRIIKEMRESTNGEYPRWLCWENVPGCYSSENGKDYQKVLEEICRIKDESISVPRPDGKWSKAGCILGNNFSLAWRTLDTQYWPGTPQRRSRCYLVADLGGLSAPEVLFNETRLSGNSAESGGTGQAVAGGAEKSIGTAGGDHVTWVCNPQGNSGVDITKDMTGTLIAQDHGNHPAVLQAAGFCTEHSAKAHSIGYQEEIAPTLRAGTVPAALSLENHPAAGRLRIQEDGCVQCLTNRMGTGGNSQPMIAEPVTKSHYSSSHGSFHMDTFEDQAGALTATDYKDPPIVTDTDGVTYIVRRLMPRECAKLQGFDPDWCSDLAIPNPTEEQLAFWMEVWETWQRLNGKPPKTEKQVRRWLEKPYTDGAEYSLWGNGISVNVGYFVLSGIVWVMNGGVA